MSKTYRDICPATWRRERHATRHVVVTFALAYIRFSSCGEHNNLIIITLSHSLTTHYILLEIFSAYSREYSAETPSPHPHGSRNQRPKPTNSTHGKNGPRKHCLLNDFATNLLALRKPIVHANQQLLWRIRNVKTAETGSMQDETIETARISLIFWIGEPRQFS